MSLEKLKASVNAGLLSESLVLEKANWLRSLIDIPPATSLDDLYENEAKRILFALMTKGSNNVP